MPSEDQTELQAFPAPLPSEKPKELLSAPGEPSLGGTGTVAGTQGVATPQEGTGQPPAAEGAGSREGGTPIQASAEVEEARRRSRSDAEPRAPGYTLLKRLGQGTFGVVWHAREDRTGREVAIKFFVHGTGQDWESIQKDLMHLAMLHTDPGIVNLIDAFADASPPYYVMGYMEKGSLAQRLEKGPVPVREAVVLFRQMAKAMAYVHAKGIRHCDLKPGNVLLDALGNPKLADFGQAHLSTDASPGLGTFFYMAPEQATLDSQIPDTRWDVYGMGALLYTLLTGAPPREDSTLREELRRTQELDHRLRRYRDVVRTAPRPRKHWETKGVDAELARLIDRCLEIEPEKRLHDAGAVLAALDQRDRIRRQRPMLVFGLVAPLLLLAVLGSLAWFQGRQVTDEVHAAQEHHFLSDEQVMAALVASAIQDQMGQKAQMVARASRQPLVREFFRTNREPPELFDKLKYLGSNKFASWSITDVSGHLRVGFNFIAKEPVTKLYGENFSWRKWFNGTKSYFDAKEKYYRCWWQTTEPRPPFLVTDPFVGKHPVKPLILGVSVPIYSAYPDEVASLIGLGVGPGNGLLVPPQVAAWQGFSSELLGVFLGNINVDALNEWLAEVRIENGYGILLDKDGHCVYHTAQFDRDLPTEVREAVRHQTRPQEDEELPRFPGNGSSAFDRVLRGERANDTHHRDPVLADERRYLAGFAPVPKFQWGVVVQHDYDKVMSKFFEMKRNLRGWGIGIVALAVALLLGLWAWFFRILRGEERVANG